MTSRQHHHFQSSLAGGVLGLLALVLVTAVLSGAIAAIQANRTIDTLAQQLTDARGQIEELRTDNGQLGTQNQKLLAQNTQQHGQLDALIRFLRRHGLDVPEVISPPPAEINPGGTAVTPPPKAPSPPPSPTPVPVPSSVPAPAATPSPTPAATPTLPGPGLGTLCDLTPILCHR